MENIPAELYLLAPVGIIYYISKCLVLGLVFLAFLAVLTNLAGTSYCLLENYCLKKKLQVWTIA